MSLRNVAELPGIYCITSQKTVLHKFHKSQNLQNSGERIYSISSALISQVILNLFVCLFVCVCVCVCVCVTMLSVSRLYSIDDRMIDEHEAVCGMKIGRGNRCTRRKPAPVPLCPSQIPHDPIWDRTQASEVGNRRLIS
jgi:hypothetical protein